MFMFVGKQKFVLSIFMNAWRIYCFLCPKIDKKLKAFFTTKRMILTPSTKILSKHFRFESLNGLPQRANSYLDFFHKKMSSRYLQT